MSLLYNVTVITLCQDECEITFSLVYPSLDTKIATIRDLVNDSLIFENETSKKRENFITYPFTKTPDKTPKLRVSFKSINLPEPFKKDTIR